MERPVELTMMYLREELTSETEKELQAWRGKGKENEALFQEFVDPAKLKNTLRGLLEIDTEKGWQELQEKVKKRKLKPRCL